VALAAELAAEESPERLGRFISLLLAEQLSAQTPAGALQDLLVLPSSRLSLYVQFLEAGRADGASSFDMALVLQGAVAAAELVRSRAPQVEVARTGPAGGTFHLRTTGTVSREIVEAAKRKLLVVGYSVTASQNSAGLAAQTLASIRRAAGRGVVITALLHRDPRNREALLHSWPPASPGPSIFTWPESSQDAMTKLHAKVIVADSTDALVTSANLTYHGYEANIELGVRVSGEPAKLVETHFRELIRAEELILWPD
jgi:phosphatidylserine/phosphatidylglycerophosphate/cardiolipin synthase-like enzyme